MADELKRVGLIFTQEGAVDFKKTLQEVNLELNKNYNQYKLTQSQWDKTTSSTQKLKAEQEYLKNAFEIQTDKVNTLKIQLADLESAENKNTTAIKKKRNELLNAQIKLEKYKNKIQEVEQKLHNVGKKIEEFGEKIQKSGDKIEKAGSKMSAFSVATTAALVSSAKSAIDFESAFTGVEKTVDGTEEQLTELKQGIRDMAKEIPSSTTEIAAVAEAAGQLGIKTENILSFSKAMIDLGNSTNLTADEAASQLAKFANIMGMSQSDFDKLGSSIVDLGNHFATTEADIVDMSMRLAGAGKQVGLSEGQVLGLATALSSVGIEAEMGGSAISKAMIKMQNAVEMGGNKLDSVLKKTGMSLRQLELMSANDSMEFKSLADGIGMTSTELKQLITAGTNLEDFAKISGMSAEEFKKAWKEDAAGALSAFIKGLGDAENKGESAITMLSEMGLTEVRLRDSLLRAANAGTLFNDAIKTGTKAWEDNTALTNEANKRYDTLKSKIQIAVNKLKDLAITFGNKLTPIVTKATSKIEDFTKWVENLTDEQVDLILRIAGVVVAIGPLLKIFGKITTIGGGAIKTIGIFTQSIGVMSGKVTTTSTAVNNLAGFMTKLTSPLGTVGLALGVVSLAVGVMAAKYNLAIAKTEELRKSSEDSLKSYNETTNAINSNMQAQLNEIDNCKILKEELEKIVDENGKVKAGYEARAKVITNQLSQSLGTEISITGNVIDRYKDLQKEIDNLILKKKGESILSGYQEKWSNAIDKRSQKTQELFDLQNNIENEQKKLDDLNTRLNNDKSGSIARTTRLMSDISETEKNLQNLRSSASNTEKEIEGYIKDINDYNYAAQLVAENTTESLTQLIDSQGRTYENNGETVNTTYKKLIQEQQYYLDTTKAMQEEALTSNNMVEAEKTKTQINETNDRLINLVSELQAQTSIVGENSPDVIDAWKQLATGSYNVYYDTVSGMDDTLATKIQEMTGVTLERTPELVDATQKMSQQVVDQIENNAEFRQEAINNLRGFLNGLQDEELRELLTAAGVQDVEKVMQGIRAGNLAEDQGISILKSLNSGLNNSNWTTSLWNSARSIASKLSGLLTVKANVNGNTSSIPGHKLGLDYVPKDNYLARLHKGERVLTKEENEEYTEAEEVQRSNGAIINTIDYNKMAEAMLSVVTQSNSRLESILIKILEKCSNKIVLDTGQLVGATSEGYDVALADLQSKRKRGN